MTDVEFYRRLGRRLRIIRRELGMSEDQAAEAFGVRVETYRGYELGRRPKNPLPFVRFVSDHGINGDWLILGKLPRLREAKQ